MNRALFFFLLATSLSLGGCSHKAKWLNGKWIFDADLTTRKWTEENHDAGQPEGILHGLKSLAKGFVAPKLASGFEGTQIKVTDQEFILTGGDGNGKASSYEVVEAPNADTITLKLSDGQISTFHHEGDHMWTTSTTRMNLPAYFKRVP
jgi:hypothetical protein